MGEEKLENQEILNTEEKKDEVNIDILIKENELLKENQKKLEEDIKFFKSALLSSKQIKSTNDENVDKIVNLINTKIRR